MIVGVGCWADPHLWRVGGGWADVLLQLFCFLLFVIVGNSLLEIGDSLAIGERLAVRSN